MNKVVTMPAVASRGNQSVSGFLRDSDKMAMREAVARKIEELFDVLMIDHRHDHNTQDTPARVAKMFVEETMKGRFSPPPQITEFDNVDGASS